MRLLSVYFLFSAICFSVVVQAQNGIIGGFAGAYSSNTTSSFDSSACRPLAKIYATDVSTSYDKTDATESIDRLQAIMKKCGLSNRSLGVPDGFFDELKHETQRQAFARVKTDIEKYSDTGKVDQFKDEYDTYAKNLNAPDREKFWNEHKALGDKAYEKEKKSCTPVDMTKELGPVRNQDSIGWCYAFTASDLLSYKLKKRVSAADVANTYNQGVLSGVRKAFGATSEKFEGGFIDSSMEDAMKKGLCLEKDLPSEDNKFSNYKDMLETFDLMGRQGIDNPGSFNCYAMAPTLQAYFPNVSLKDLKEIISTSSKKDFVDTAIDKTCKKRIPADLKVENFYPWTIQGAGDKVDDLLSQKIPVGISYDAGVLYNRRNWSQGYWHTSILAGRRFNNKTGQCEYLLRNSWGRSCDPYDSSYQCKDGNIWIPKRDILKTTREYTYVK